MATMEDILSKKMAKKKSAEFSPKKRRAWDYATNDKSNQISKPESAINLAKDKGLKTDSNNQPPNTKIFTQEAAIEGTQKDTQWDTRGNDREHKGAQEVTIEDTQWDTRGNDNRQTKQLSNNLEKELARLSGVQKKIFYALLELSSQNSLSEAIFIRRSTLSELTNTTIGSVKTSVKRLIDKRLLRRERGILARGGGLNLCIPDEVIQALSTYKLNLEIQEKMRKQSYQEEIIRQPERGHIKGNDKAHNSIYSSSSNINTTKKELPENWLSINTEPLNDIGFSLTQLKQLYTKSLNTPEIIQESINHFAFGLESNPKLKKYSEPLNVLMGVLRKSQAWIEQNYVSPQEIAQRQLLENKKTEMERIKQLEKEAYNLALEEWLKAAPKDQLEKIAPSKTNKNEITPQRVRLSLYFKENVWPEKMSDYLV